MAEHGGGDGLWRWLLGGLVGGAIVLGLLVAAYAIGYHRGEDHARPAAAPPPATTSTQAAATTTAAAPSAPAPATADLLARGKELYTADGCAACHSLDGSAGAGPTFKGLAGSSVTLDGGQTVTADAAYLSRSITEPDAEIVKGYAAGIMSAAIAGHDLSSKPDQVRALVAFVEAQG